MSRMSSNPPDGGIKYQKISDTEAVAWLVTARPLGAVRKTDDGWEIPDGTKFMQQEDAGRQLAADIGEDIPPTVRARKKRARAEEIVEAVSGGRVRLLGVDVDSRLRQFAGWPFYRAVRDGDTVVVFGGRTAEGQWEELGIFDVA